MDELQPHIKAKNEIHVQWILKNKSSFAEENSNRSAALKFNIDVKRVQEWRQNKDKIFVMKEKRQKLDGGGRKLTDQQLEEELLK